MARIPITEMTPELWGDYSTMKLLTCSNHPNLEWSTKGPGRSMHYLSGYIQYPECSCPWTDLVVLTGEDSRYDD